MLPATVNGSGMGIKEIKVVRPILCRTQKEKHSSCQIQSLQQISLKRVVVQRIGLNMKPGQRATQVGERKDTESW